MLLINKEALSELSSLELTRDLKSTAGSSVLGFCVSGVSQLRLGSFREKTSTIPAKLKAQDAHVL